MSEQLFFFIGGALFAGNAYFAFSKRSVVSAVIAVGILAVVILT